VAKKRGGGILAEAELAAVKPGDERGLRWCAADLGQLAGQPPKEQAAVGVQLRQQRVEPRIAVGESGFGGDYPEQPDVIGLITEARKAVPGPRRRSDSERALEPGKVKRLRSRGQRDTPFTRSV